MIVDAQNRFSDAQALTASAPSVDELDFGIARDMGKGEPMAVIIIVEVAADTASGNETYQIDVRTDTQADMGGTPVNIATRIIAGADLTLGSVHVLPLPLSNERYLDVNYTLGGTTPSVTLSAYLQPMSMIDSTVDYANGYSIT